MKKNPLSDVSSRKKREPMPKVSFARDIRPLFRAVDIAHMKRYKIKLPVAIQAAIEKMNT